jgi:predicted anti-sigma-YlaC factor YlaD
MKTDGAVKRAGLFFRAVYIAVFLCLFPACSINKLVINKVSDALTGEGQNEVFTGDDDPELVADALPFAVKLYESLLAQNPKHEGLIVTTGSLYIMYANAFVQGPAEMLPPEDYEAKQAAMERAAKLYLRGAAIIESGLEAKYPGWTEARKTPEAFAAQLAKTKKADIPLLYWNAAGVLSAWALNPFDLDLGIRINELSALVARAYELDPDYGGGALDEFYLLFYASLPEGMGGDKAKAKVHYQRALEKTGGRSAGPYVSYAKAVAVPAQDYQTFKTCLEAALAIDVEQKSAGRLVNILNQRRARYLLDEADSFFAEIDED